MCGSSALVGDHHRLEVSGGIDGLVGAAVEAAPAGVRASPATPVLRVAMARSRCPLDITYADSPLAGEHLGAGVEPPAPPGPDDRFPRRAALTGTAHHPLISDAADAAGLKRLHRCRPGLVNIVDDSNTSSSSSEALLVSPDGHIGFRTVPADAAGLAVVDTFLDFYLVPATP